MTVEISQSSAWGIGLATVTAEEQVLDTWYPPGFLGLGDEPGEAPVLPAGLAGPKALGGLSTVEVRTVIGSLADPIKDAADAYLRLHLLSHRLVRPNALNLDGIFGHLAERGLDLRRAVPTGPGRRAAPHRARGRPAPVGVRGGQVPADDRLRGAVRRPDRRLGPGPPGRPPGRAVRP